MTLQPLRSKSDAIECLEYLLQEAINGVICEPDQPDTCERCAANWAKVRKVLDERET